MFGLDKDDVEKIVEGMLSDYSSTVKNLDYALSESEGKVRVLERQVIVLLEDKKNREMKDKLERLRQLIGWERLEHRREEVISTVTCSGSDEETFNSWVNPDSPLKYYGELKDGSIVEFDTLEQLDFYIKGLLSCKKKRKKKS